MYATFFFLPPLLRFAEAGSPAGDTGRFPPSDLGPGGDMTGRLKAVHFIGTAALVALGAVASFFISFEGE